MDAFIGFDSAWTDNPKILGAICAVEVESGKLVRFHGPRLVSFDQALTFIGEVRSSDGSTLIALDQPTIVANATGMRPVERVAASLISWLGGGVQPSNRGRLGMFCDASPIWRFLNALQAIEDPRGSEDRFKRPLFDGGFPCSSARFAFAQFFRAADCTKIQPRLQKDVPAGTLDRCNASGREGVGTAEMRRGS